MKWFFALLPTLLLADKVAFSDFAPEIPAPWVTGPLLAPSGYVVPGGDSNYEPYLYVTGTFGSYNEHWNSVSNPHSFWQAQFQPVIQVGLTSWMDFQVAPTLTYNYIHHQANWLFTDLLFGFDFQLYDPGDPSSPIPAVKLQISETFPTGTYNRRNPNKLGADISGQGSYQTTFGLVFGKMWYFGSVYFLNGRLALEYNLPSPVRLRGINAYGGASDTNATLYPSQNFRFDVGLEMTLSQNWVFACDIVGNWWTKTHFKGDPGRNPDGSMASLGNPHFGTQYALAPAIEYNWSANIGIIAGAWFTVAGKYTPQFCSSVIAFNYYQ